MLPLPDAVMESMMTALNGLTFAAAPRLNGLTRQQKRRGS